jgi:hypothetical protein
MSRVGVQRKGKIGVCVMCRHPFQTSRSDALTCGTKCRKAWQRFNQERHNDELHCKSEKQQMERLNDLINVTQKRVMRRFV